MITFEMSEDNHKYMSEYQKVYNRRYTFYLVILLTIFSKLALVKKDERLLIRQKLILKFH